MSQSTILVGALLAAFVLYLAKGNRLGVYYGVVFGPAAPGGAAPGSATLNPASPSFNPAQVGQNAGTWLRNLFSGLFGGGGS